MANTIPPPSGFKPLGYRLAAYVGLIVATIAAFYIGFVVFNLTQFSHQALLIFEATNSPSPSFLREEIQAVEAAHSALAKSRAALETASQQHEKAASDAVEQAQRLYELKTAFKQDAVPYLLRLTDKQVAAVQWGLEFASLENNRALLVRACSAAKPLVPCVDNGLPLGLHQAWTRLVDAQKTEQITRDRLVVASAALTQKRADHATRLAEANATAATSPAKRAVMTQYQAIKKACLANMCLTADSNLQGLLVVLAVIMGAAGGSTLAWLRLVGSAAPTPIRDMFWPIPSGALAAAIGYFVILFGATLLNGETSSASPVDPRTVVALSLILGLGAQDALEAFKSIGVAVRDLVPRVLARVGA